MTTVIAFIVALTILIFVHEGGHYLAARMCGVKVRKFSIGFGKPLVEWIDGAGTSWSIGWIPLGGYVAMLDGKADGDANEDLSKAFTSKTILQRMFIIAAGPMANFVAAWFILSTMLAIPHQTWTPVLGSTYKSSIAHNAGFRDGDTVLTVNGEAVELMDEWQDALVRWAVAPTSDLSVKVLTAEGKLKINVLPAPEKPIQPQEGWMKALGWAYIGKLPQQVVLGKVENNGPFAKAGIKSGDTINEMNGEAVSGWNDLLVKIGSMPNTKIEIGFTRNGEKLKSFVQTDSLNIAGVVLGRVGVSTPLPEVEKKLKHLNFVQAATDGAKRTVMLIDLTFDGVARLVTGRGSSDQLSGPMGIAEEAGKSAEHGATGFFSFLAMLSVSLGVLNLLPIPVLDGGHLVMLAIEKIKGTPISFRIERLALMAGFVLIGSLTIIGFLNDARKIFGG